MSEQRQRVELDRMRAEMAAKETSRPGLDVAGLVTALGTALAPVIGMMMNASKERVDAEREQRRIDAEQRRLENDRAAEQRRLDNERLMALMSKPSGPDPMTELLLRSMQEQAKNTADMSTRMIDSVSATSKMSIAMIETIADIQLGGQPEGNPLLDVVKEGVRGFMALTAASNAGAKKAAAQAAAPMPVPTQLSARAPAAPQQSTQVPQRSSPQPTATAQPSAPSSADIHKFEKVPVEAMQSAKAAEESRAFDGIDSDGDEDEEDSELPEAFRNRAGESTVDVMERCIRAKHRPIEEIAAYIVVSQENPDVVAALEKHDGNFSALIGERFGTDWLLEGENAAYINELAEAAAKVSQEIEEDSEDNSDE
jgi:hypothetical protein